MTNAVIGFLIGTKKLSPQQQWKGVNDLLDLTLMPPYLANLPIYIKDFTILFLAIINHSSHHSTHISSLITIHCKKALPILNSCFFMCWSITYDVNIFWYMFWLRFRRFLKCIYNHQKIIVMKIFKVTTMSILTL
jgi:hypothetical protein